MKPAEALFESASNARARAPTPDAPRLILGERQIGWACVRVSISLNAPRIISIQYNLKTFALRSAR